MLFRFCSALFLALTAAAVQAAPTPYMLQADRSEVGFVYTLSGGQNPGSMPVRSADIAIDLQQFSNSTVDVVVDVTKAKTGLIFATEALKAVSVLNADAHPTIRFRSTAIRPNDPRNLSLGGEIDGQLTIRGITRSVTLDAAVFRQQGTDATDMSQLSFRINGSVNRTDFGANGYSDIVGDRILLDIAARVTQVR